MDLHVVPVLVYLGDKPRMYESYRMGTMLFRLQTRWSFPREIRDLVEYYVVTAREQVESYYYSLTKIVRFVMALDGYVRTV